MQARLHEYQERSIEFFFSKKKCALWLDMGLGKTLTAITSIQRMKDRFLIDKTLVIAPLRVANNVWDTEINKWDHTKHLTVSKVLGSTKERLKAIESEADIYVINRENIPWLLENGYKEAFDFIIIDESSSFKSSKSKRFKALKKFKYDYMLQLTGTPSPNSLLDIWSQIYLIDSGKALGKNFTSYKAKMFDSDFMGYNFTPKSEQAIYDQISDLVISMKAEDYLTLPDRINIQTKVSIPSMKEYNELQKEFLLEMNGEFFEAKNAAVLTGKLLQLANGGIYNELGEFRQIHDEKLKALDDIIGDNPNDNFLVAYNFKSDLFRLKEKFKYALTLDDGCDIIERWNQGKIKLLLCHPASASMGLNLQQGGNNIIWFGLTWNLESYMQFNARLHRQGQTKPVVINHIISSNTIDEIVLNSLKNKLSTQEALFAAVKDQIPHSAQ